MKYYAAHYRTSNKSCTMGEPDRQGRMRLARTIVAYPTAEARDMDVASKDTHSRPVEAVHRSECTAREIAHALDVYCADAM